ncbi:MAG: hypothetical protein GF320_21725 [Armatimonadia bacterium]|nr:hypothetical protein [Armatimonadia bacterium]
MFWDGRTTGEAEGLNDPVAEQAMGPFLNPMEQNVPQMKLVVSRVAKSDYAHLFEEAGFPAPAFKRKDEVKTTYINIAIAISAYEHSEEVNPFSSKYDAYLAGHVELSDQEAWGLELFEGKAMCSACHISEPGPNGEPPLFTDFTYDNLGTPRNPDNPFYSAPPSVNPDGAMWVDLGLGAFLDDPGEYGKVKVPTLRNVDKRPYPGFVKAYMHNGVFKSLEEVVSFYNTRDVDGAGWPEAEAPVNVNKDELGDLGLNAEEEAALVAFMKTLSDGYTG